MGKNLLKQLQDKENKLRKNLRKIWSIFPKISSDETPRFSLKEFEISLDRFVLARSVHLISFVLLCF